MTSSTSALVGTATTDTTSPYTEAKPVFRGWLHLVWFELSLVAGTVLVLHSRGDERVATTIYAITVSTLFGTSALYHRGTWGHAAHRLLQRLDHAMIFLLIAGSATPVFVANLEGAAQATLLSIMWGLTGIALLTHLIWMNAPELLVGSTFVGLGLIGTAALPAVWINTGVLASVLIAVGGALYILGALLYHRRSPNPSPEVFGYHEVFHAFVCAGATVHFIVIAYLIV